MSIISVDPGYDRCGVAFLEKKEGTPSLIFSTCIQTNKKDTGERRLAHLFSTVQKLCAEYTPSALAMEQLFFSNNQKTALRVAEARGVILAIAGTHSIPVFEYGPGQVKVAVTGHGAADKKQVISMVHKLISLPHVIQHDDEYDAIAIGLTHLACVH